MGRRRESDTELPKRVYQRRGAFYFVRKDGVWIPLGRDRARAIEVGLDLSHIACFAEAVPKAYLARIYARAKERSKRRGHPFELSPDEFRELWRRADGRCEVTGLPFRLAAAQRGSRRPYAPSLDRTDSSLPYSVENCRLVCTAVNIAMNEWGTEVLDRIVEARMNKSRRVLNNAARIEQANLANEASC